MKIIFAGTPEFAAIALDALVAARYEIGLVLTQPDRPAGRGLHSLPSAVKKRAIAHNLQIAQPATLKDADIQAKLRAINAEVMVVVAYGLLLPAAVLSIPARGCLNIHASLLPRWRGAAPIQRALLAGDGETGVTIMQMDEGLDTGPILLREKIPIYAEDTAQTLHDKLASLGACIIVRALRERPSPETQDGILTTYAGKIVKAEALVDWSRSSIEIDRQLRAFNPAPGAATIWNGAPLKLWRAEIVAHGSLAPGTIVSAGPAGVVVATGDGALKITELQKAGGKRLTAAAFLAGAALIPGTRLGA